MKKKFLLIPLAALLAAAIPLTSILLRGQTSGTYIVPEPILSEDFEGLVENSTYERGCFYSDNANAKIVNSGVVLGKAVELNIPHKLNWGSFTSKSEVVKVKNSSFSLSVDFLPTNIDSIDISILKDFTPTYYSQYGVKLFNNEGGTPSEIGYRFGEALLEENEIVNPLRTLNNGLVHLSFEFDVEEVGATISFRFHSIKDNATVKIDNITLVDLNNLGTEYKIQYVEDFDSINGFSVFDETIFWSDLGDFNFIKEGNDQKVRWMANYYRSNGDNVLVGGVTRSEMSTHSQKLYYYSFDFRLVNVKTLVLTTLDNCGNGQIYSEITYSIDNDTFSLTAQGGIKNFRIEKKGDTYHLSYNRITSAFGADEHYMFATSTPNQVSQIILDNFVCVYKEM